MQKFPIFNLTTIISLDVIPRIPVILVAASLTIHLLHAQERILSTEIALSDWGLTSPADIRFGVLIVTHNKNADLLKTSVLRTSVKREFRANAPRIPREHPRPVPPTRTTPPSRSTWIWNTDELLHDSAHGEKTISAIEQAHVTRVFLQLPANFVADNSHDAALRSFIQRFYSRGAVVEALAGDPLFSLPENHDVVMRLIRRVIDYNANSSDDSRFVGVHLDIEPYLLPGFGGPRKDSILKNYLTISDQAAAATHAGQLLYSTDIPFWYGMPDEFTGRIDSIEFDGVRKPVNEHIIDLADEICIMSYRTKVRGMNSIISLSEDLLSYAETQKKTAYVGIETSSLPDEDNVYFQGIPATDSTALGKSDKVVFVQQDGDSAKVVLLERKQLGSVFSESRNRSDPPHYAFLWEVRNTSAIPSANLSFARLGRKQLEASIGEVMRELSGYASFAGVAIHHEASYEKLQE